MSKFINQFLLAVYLSLTSLTITANDANISGVYIGYFAYDDQSLEDGTFFTMALVQKVNTLSGVISEVVVHNNREVVATSTLDGFILGDKILFTKKYDGSGGRDHTVAYELTVKDEVLFGNWKINNATGPVVMGEPHQNNFIDSLESLLENQTD